MNSSLISTSQWQTLKKQLQQVLNISTERLGNNEQIIFFKNLGTIQQAFKQHTDAFWYRITVGLEAQAKRQWNIQDTRSKEMGENIKWLAEKYPNKKMVVWAHTWHLTKEGNNEINAGKVLSDHFKDDYYMVHFTGVNGRYLDFIDMKIRPVKPVESNAIESVVNKLSASKINFIDLTNVKDKVQELTLYANDYNLSLPSNVWPKYFDGVFISREVKPANFIE